MTLICDCDNCKNLGEMKGFQATCKAFPDGIPYTFDMVNASQLDECNNGIKFEPKEENA